MTPGRQLPKLQKAQVPLLDMCLFDRDYLNHATLISWLALYSQIESYK